MRFTRKPTPSSETRDPKDPEADLIPRRRRTLVLLGVVIGALTLLLVAWLSQVTGYAVVLGKEIPVRALITGQVVWAAPAGAHVRKGDRIAEIDGTEVRLQLGEIEAELEMAKAEIELERRNVERELAEHRTRQEEARILLAKEVERHARHSSDLELEDYMRRTTASLYEHHLVSEREQEAVKHSQRTSQIGVKHSLTILNQRKKQLRDIEVVVESHFKIMAQRERLADARLHALESRKARIERDVQDTLLSAPIDGIVATRHSPTGTHIWEGEMVLSVLDSESLSVAVFVLEKELTNTALSEQQEVQVRFSSHPLRTVSGKVTEQYARFSPEPTLTPLGIDPYWQAPDGMILASRVHLSPCPFPVRPGMTGTVLLGRRSPLWPIEQLLGGFNTIVGL